MYSFEKRGAFDTVNPSWVRADHTVEIVSVFGFGFVQPDIKFSAEDKTLSKTMMSYWTNFARTG